MPFPVTLEYNRLLNQIRYLEEREQEADTTLQCVRAERAQIVDMLRLGMSSSGDRRLDFTLVACGCIHDRSVDETYRTLESDLANAVNSARGVSATIVTVQTAYVALSSGGLAHLRCIHLATAVKKPIVYNVHNSVIDIPTAAGVYVRSEIVDFVTGVVTTHDGLRDGAWITVGPLKNKYCTMPRAQQSSQGRQYLVPYDAPFLYTMYPCDRTLLEKLDVDLEHMTECMRRWTQLRATIRQRR